VVETLTLEATLIICRMLTDYWKVLGHNDPTVIKRLFVHFDRGKEGDLNRSELCEIIVEYLRCIPEIQRQVLRMGRYAYAYRFLKYAVCQVQRGYESRCVNWIGLCACWETYSFFLLLASSSFFLLLFFFSFVSRALYRGAIYSLGSGMCDNVFAAIDVNKIGVITLEDFTAHFAEFFSTQCVDECYCHSLSHLSSSFTLCLSVCLFTALLSLTHTPHVPCHFLMMPSLISTATTKAYDSLKTSVDMFRSMFAASSVQGKCKREGQLTVTWCPCSCKYVVVISLKPCGVIAALPLT
jgi:hypothetical protein